MNWFSRLCSLGWIRRNWADPVWSKVFAAGIVFLVTTTYLFLKSVLQSVSVEESYNRTFIFLVYTKYEINLFTIVVLGALVIILFLTPRIIAMIRNYEPEKLSPNNPANGAEIVAITSTDIPVTHRIMAPTSTDIPITNELVMQLDASDISTLFLTVGGNATVTADNQPVALWKDKSGNNNDLCQVRPQLCPRFVMKGIGNLPSVQFDIGKSMVMTRNFPTPVSVIYVARQTGGWNRRVLSAVENNWLLGYWDNAKNQGHFQDWVSETGRPLTDDLCHIFSGIVRGPGYVSEVWADGSIVAANQKGLEGPNGLAINAGQYPGESSDCQVSEIIVFNRDISEIERMQVETYLKEKWHLKY